MFLLLKACTCVAYFMPNRLMHYRIFQKHIVYSVHMCLSIMCIPITDQYALREYVIYRCSLITLFVCMHLLHLCYSQLIKALVAAFKKCTLPQQHSASDTPAAVTTTTVTTTTTTATSTTTTTTTTVGRGSGNDVRGSVDTHDISGSSNGIYSTTTQHGDADAPEIKVKLEKAKVHLTYHIIYTCMFQTVTRQLCIVTHTASAVHQYLYEAAAAAALQRLCSLHLRTVVSKFNHICHVCTAL
jgi:hypothetical protein